MSREPYRSDGYFKDYIAYERNRIQKFSAILSETGEKETAKRTQCSRYIASFEKNLISAMYSFGASKSEIREEFGSYLDAVKKSEVSSYAEMADLLSMAVIFETPADELAQILSIDTFDDALIKSLKDYAEHGPGTVFGARDTASGAKLSYGDAYGAFWDYLVSEEARGYEKFVTYMEEEWYPSCRDMAWYDSHNGSNDTYAGYWCWLAAAVLKMKNQIPLQRSIKYIPVELIRS